MVSRRFLVRLSLFTAYALMVIMFVLYLAAIYTNHQNGV